MIREIYAPLLPPRRDSPNQSSQLQMVLEQGIIVIKFEIEMTLGYTKTRGFTRYFGTYS